ncbi:Protein FIP2 [Linum grandiflorum]
MSSAVAAAADSSSRKVPPPCWTREETVELIKAYRDKWFAVNRGNLRAADWDTVAAALADSPAPSDPPKSAVQCRHKIEKIRKRYRAEKQRCVNFPGRFFSSWDLFPLLDSMEIGSIGSKQDKDVDKPNNENDRYEGLEEPDLDFDPDLVFRARKFGKVAGGFNESVVDYDHGSRGGYGNKIDQNPVSVAFMPKDYGRFDRKIGGNHSNTGFDSDYGGGGFSRKMGQLQRDDMMNRVNEERDRFGKKVVEEWGYGSSRIRVKNNMQANGFGSGNTNGGKGKDPVAEVVSAIKMLREGFVMVEEMKMDMAMEIEKMRMGMELKHNQMLIEMQQDIVDAFAKAYVKKKNNNNNVKKNKKRKMDVSSSPNSHRNAESEIAATEFETID